MLILLLLGAALAWYLQFVLYEKFWNHGLAVEVRFEDSYVYEGDTSYLRESIINDKVLPLPALEVRLAVDRSLLFSGEAGKNASISDKNYQRDVFAFFGRQKVIRKIPFVCRKRGFYQITKSEIVGYDLLYLHEYYQECPQQTEFYVYPALVDVSRIQLICQTISGMMLAQRRLYPDPFEFSGIREYQMTDPMNHINWKASARSGSLMVNQYDSTTSVSLTIFLDVEDSGIWRNEDLVEESIRIAASLAAVLSEKGMELDLVSNAKLESAAVQREQAETANENTADFCMHMKSGTGLLQEMNQKMACIDITAPTERMSELILQKNMQKKAGQIYILISKNVRENLECIAKELADASGQIIWVVPHKPNQEEEIPEGRLGIRFIRWEVD